MTTFNRETLIFLGIAVLLINIVITALLKRKFRPVNALNTVVAIVAGAMVIVGIAQVTLLPKSTVSANAAFAAPNTAVSSTSGNNADTAPTNVSFNSSRTNGASQNQNPNAANQADSSGVTTGSANAPANGPRNGSATGSNAASGNANASTNTNTNTSANNAGGTSANRSSSTSATTSSPVSTLVAAAQSAVPFLTIAGGLLVLFAGMLIYASERQQAAFRRFRSLGFLNMSIGLLIVAVMIGLPMVVAQASSNNRAAVVITPLNGPAAARQGLPTPTPTQVAAPSATPSPLPTLTPTPSPTPIVLSTPVKYTASTQSTSVTACSVSAQTVMNLRQSPSTSQAAIGRVLAGTMLKVTGKSSDGQWYHVITPDNVSGWVSAQYVTTYSGCTADAVPVVTSTPTK